MRIYALFPVFALSVAWAQGPTATAFEVASIRQEQGSPSPLQFTSEGVRGTVTIRALIRNAYGVNDYQLAGGPGWLQGDFYHIEAKVAAAATTAQVKLMLQNLLQERLQLAVHRESKEMSVYLLTAEKGGSKLHEIKDGEPPPAAVPAMAGAEGSVRARGNVRTLSDAFSALLGRPVVDRTGLTGEYFTVLQWGRDRDVLTAIEEDLGLKLESARAPVEILVVDRVERPSAN